jgi:peptidoglycan hydrolase-like amidase
VFEERNPRWKDAVKSTESKVLSWERKVVKAPYFSSDNGRTKSALDVWGWEHTPYLNSKDDPWCKGMSNAGHGVGMSGCGAEGQANEGKTAEEILHYYYPGTKILPVHSLRN